MITIDEKKNIALSPSEVCFPNKRYAIEAMDSLIEAYNEYIAYYSNVNFNFSFSSGEEIKWRIFDHNLAHLLGIDLKYLKSEPMRAVVEDILKVRIDEKIKSFDLLERIIKYADEIIEHDSIRKDLKILNYYRLMVKSIVFLHILKFHDFDFGCISFNPETFTLTNNGLKINRKSTKVLFFPSMELQKVDFSQMSFHMLGLVYDNKVGMYVPETTCLPSNILDFFKGQELIVPTQIASSYDDGSYLKKAATSQDKIKILNMYKQILMQCGIHKPSINVADDYERMLRISRR